MAGCYRGVILDVDGTLVDSNDAHAHAWVEAFAERGFAVSFSAVRRLIGMGGDKLIPAATGHEEDETPVAGIGERRTAIFRERWLPTVRALPGSRALVAALAARGLGLVIGTSAKKDELAPLLAIAGVDDLVPLRTTSDDADRSKPEPDIVAVALGKLGLAAAEVVMIGDTPYDIVAAERAGVATIAVRSGGWSDAQLGAAIAIYRDPADLLAHIDGSPLAAAISRT
jgi:HAD superfamily hydrolase (TIGR01509 family)